MPIRINLDVMLAKRKMRLGELSEQVGVSATNLSILKTGKAKAVRFTTLEAICEALNCQPGDILSTCPTLPRKSAGELQKALTMGRISQNATMARLRRKRPQRKQTDERKRKSPSCTDLEASDDKHVRRRAHLGKLDGSRVLAFALCTPPFEKAANAVLMIGPLVIAPAGYSLALMLASAAVTLIIGACAARRRSARTTPCARDKTESATARRKTHREPTDPAVHRDEFDRAVHRKAHDKPRCVRAQRRTQPYRPLDRQRTRRLRHRRDTCDVGAFLPYQQVYTADPPSYAGIGCGGGAKRAFKRVRNGLLRAARNRIWSRDRPLRRR